MKPKKFVSSLSSLTLEWLSLIESSTEESKRTRLRAQAIRLSNDRYSINDISKICQATRKTVSGWLAEWEKHDFDSLIEKPRSGRKPIIPEDLHEEVIDIVQENPKQIKAAISKIEEKLGKTVSAKTVKRIIKKKLRWKRARKSLKNKRNEKEFKIAQKDLEMLKEQDNNNVIDLYYFDESGFTGVPEVPYVWQDPDEPLLLPSGKTPRINVLGFLNRHNDFFPYVFECSVNSEVTVACFDSFSLTLDKPTIVILDNASIHHSQRFESEIKKWEDRGLFLYYLPKYSPELNLIEILWKHIKYYWLPVVAYKCFVSLKAIVRTVFSMFL